MERWRSASAYPGLNGQAQTVETIAKWFDLPYSIYRNQKRSEHVLDCVQYLTHETEKQRTGKHHYDDSEIKANFDFRGRKEKCACATGRNFLNETGRYEVLYKNLDIRQVIEQNRLSRAMSGLISSGVNAFTRDRSNAFNAYQLLHLCRR